MRTDTSHLVALHESLARENARLDAATTPKETAFRRHCIAMKKREIASEFAFLGMNAILPEMSDDDLLAALEIEGLGE